MKDARTGVNLVEESFLSLYSPVTEFVFTNQLAFLCYKTIFLMISFSVVKLLEKHWTWRCDWLS